ncbi:hypothetical protein VaNZ11_004834 [Volvox africanus]|uniref:PB1 domain-containing protein n=1 Tax=Volvox africanus TaxID=51714 RepID=A0ABQ5RYJ7_9CHLO|nr:hypothetical protein VaNZ11_004834 [Volvox africanus]
MTKVECPGPGFKGLKWKWIQDHAKEQQEREKERLSVQDVQIPESAAQPSFPQQHAVPNNSAERLPAAEPCVQKESLDRQSGGGWELTQPGVRNVMSSRAGVKAEPMHGLSGATPALAAPWAAAVHALLPEERTRLKDEQEGKVVRWTCEALTSPAPSSSGVAALDVGNPPVLNMATLASVTAGASACIFGAASGTAVAASLAGSGISPSPAMPATGVMVRGSVDGVAPMPAAPVVFSPPGVLLPPAPFTSATEVTHCAGTAVATTQTVVHTSAVAAMPVCTLTPPSVPAVAPPPSVTHQPGGGPSSSVPALAAGAQRVRLPPAKVPSITLSTVAAKGGDDFESMFTPLSSLPVIKSETPRVGIMSRGGSLLLGVPASLPGAATGSAAATGAAAVTAAQDVGAHPPGGERRAPLRKASRVQDGRTSVGQLTGAAGHEQAEADQAPTVRSRTPVTQISAAAGSTSGTESAKEVPAGTATACAASVTTGGKTPQQSQPLQVHAQGQSAPPPSPQLLLQQQPATQHQRACGTKYGKDAVRLQDSGDGLAPPPGAIAVGAAVGLGCTMSFGARGATCAERPAAPVSAGSTPVAAPTRSGGEAGERKRPRSEGSKPKAGASLSGDGHGYAENLWPYGICTETLADRIKRAKRTTTSSSDQDGPYSHGGSAERLTHAAHVGHFVSGGDGPANIVNGARVTRGDAEDPPRPAVSAEAQSRGVEPAAAGKSSHRGLQAPTGPGGGVGAGGGGGSGGGGAKQPQQQRQQGREKSVGRAEDALASGILRNGAVVSERPSEQPASNNNLRMSGGGAVTDSSGGGAAGAAAGNMGSNRVSAVSAGAKATGGGVSSGMPTPSGTAAGAGTRRPAADIPLSSRRQIPVTKILRSDPHLPRPNQPHGQDRRSAGHGETTAAAAAAAAGSGGRVGATALPPPPSSKPMHRASCGMRLGLQGPADGHGPPSNGMIPGHAPSPALQSPSTAWHGRPGETDMPAAGSCKGPVVAGSGGSKDCAGDKGACGPRHGDNAIDAACGGTGGATGGGGAGAAATTTTEPKTDSDTRTSRVVECFFEFDLASRVPGTSASISGLVSTGSLQGGHGLAARVGNGRFVGAAAAVAPLLHRAGGGGGGIHGTGATAAAAQLLDLGKVRSFKELWTQLASLYDGTLPDEMDSKMIYLDEDGDWIMVTPDEPWSSVAASATKVLVTNRT